MNGADIERAWTELAGEIEPLARELFWKRHANCYRPESIMDVAPRESEPHADGTRSLSFTFQCKDHRETITWRLSLSR